MEPLPPPTRQKKSRTPMGTKTGRISAGLIYRRRVWSVRTPLSLTSLHYIEPRARASPHLRGAGSSLPFDMLADIYRTLKPNVFLLVQRGNALDRVPTEILQNLGHPVFLNTREICDPQLGIECSRLSGELERQGFSVSER